MYPDDVSALQNRGSHSGHGAKQASLRRNTAERVADERFARHSSEQRKSKRVPGVEMREQRKILVQVLAKPEAWIQHDLRVSDMRTTRARDDRDKSLADMLDRICERRQPVHGRKFPA